MVLFCGHFCPHASSARAGQPPKHVDRSSCVHGAICARRSRCAKCVRLASHGKPSVRVLTQTQTSAPTSAAFMRIDAFWSLFGVLSQLQKRGSDCAVKK